MSSKNHVTAHLLKIKLSSEIALLICYLCFRTCGIPELYRMETHVQNCVNYNVWQPNGEANSAVAIAHMSGYPLTS
jgi:hypothetical protein